MSSIFPGFEYDIFISYRQKDNKGDKWVSEFVEALKTELESTFKEEISLYFETAIEKHEGMMVFFQNTIRQFPEFEQDSRIKQLFEKAGFPYP